MAFFAKLRQDALTEADALKSVVDWLQLAARPSFDLCVRVILDDFVTNFRNAINDLTHNFPKDARNVEKDTGVDLGAFWHGHKRFPQAAAFDPTNQQHVDYVYHGANILASVFGLHEQEREAVVRAVSSMSVQPWQYTGGKVDMSGQEGENKEQDSSAPTSLADEDAQLIEQLTTQLQQLDTNGIKRMKPADFEKGQPTALTLSRRSLHLYFCSSLDYHADVLYCAVCQTSTATTTSTSSPHRPTCERGTTTSSRQPAPRCGWWLVRSFQP